MLLALRLHNGFVWWVIEVEMLESELWSWFVTDGNWFFIMTHFPAYLNAFASYKSWCFAPHWHGPRKFSLILCKWASAHGCGLNRFALHALSCFEYLIDFYYGLGAAGVTFPIFAQRVGVERLYCCDPVQLSARCVATHLFPEFYICAIEQPWCYFGLIWIIWIKCSTIVAASV